MTAYAHERYEEYVDGLDDTVVLPSPNDAVKILAAHVARLERRATGLNQGVIAMVLNAVLRHDPDGFGQYIVTRASQLAADGQPQPGRAAIIPQPRVDLREVGA